MSTLPTDPRGPAVQRRARIHALRLRIAAAAVGMFLLLWTVLFVQLASGHDPGLASATTAIVQSADPDAALNDDDDDGDDGLDSGAVVTRQS